MNIEKLSNGDLRMSANFQERRDIKKLRKESSSEIAAESQFICEFLGGDPMGNGVDYEQVAPETVNCLTSAPLISDGENIFGFMDYQIKNFLEELQKGKSVEWIKR